MIPEDRPTKRGDRFYLIGFPENIMTVACFFSPGSKNYNSVEDLIAANDDKRFIYIENVESGGVTQWEQCKKV